MTQVILTAVETIHYTQTYDLEYLEEVAGVTLADANWDMAAFLERLQTEANNNTYVDGFCEGLERHGDVQGQEWSAEVVSVHG